MEAPKYKESNNNEQLKIKTKIISQDSLVDLIYGDDSYPKDRRFYPVGKGGVFKYLNLDDIAGNSRFSAERVYPIVYENDKVVGISELEKDPNNDHNFWIKFVSIDPEYQNKGYASLLLDQIFKFAKDGNCTLQPSRYSEEGLIKLKMAIEKRSIETGVKIIERKSN